MFKPIITFITTSTLLASCYLVASENTHTNVAIASNSFNPQISLILDGQYTSYAKDAHDYKLPGFGLGGEAGLAPAGFSLGHSEIVLSSNIDDKFYGQFTFILAEHSGGERENKIEEAFIQTIGLTNGFTVTAGRFFSNIGYMNRRHKHAWNFFDAPLVYQGIWGNKYIDDGLSVSWIAPSDLFIELGAEVLSGGTYPSGSEKSDGVGAQVTFINLGGDFSASSSWQAGTSYYIADTNKRKYGAHDHGGTAETPQFTGDTNVVGLNFIYKWAPQGNYKDRHFKLQTEYFSRDEDGTVTILNSSPLESTDDYTGKQQGAYLQAIYQFMPQWRTGLRYEWLDSDNSGDAEVLEEAQLKSPSDNPNKYSISLDYIPSEFSRVRLQYNKDKSYQQEDDQVILQYTMSLGSHGAHTF
jgi:hypothetical protein